MYKVKIVSESNVEEFTSSIRPSVDEFSRNLILIALTDDYGFIQRHYINSNLIKSISVIKVGE